MKDEGVSPPRELSGRRSSRFVCSHTKSEDQIFLTVNIHLLSFHCIKRGKVRDGKTLLVRQSSAYVQ